MGMYRSGGGYAGNIGPDGGKIKGSLTCRQALVIRLPDFAGRKNSGIIAGLFYAQALKDSAQSKKQSGDGFLFAGMMVAVVFSFHF